jgi:hypothetical protein
MIACLSVPVPAPGAGLTPRLSPVFVTVNVAALKTRLVPVVKPRAAQTTTINTEINTLLPVLFIIPPVVVK